MPKGWGASLALPDSVHAKGWGASFNLRIEHPCLKLGCGFLFSGYSIHAEGWGAASKLLIDSHDRASMPKG